MTMPVVIGLPSGGPSRSGFAWLVGRREGSGTENGPDSAVTGGDLDPLCLWIGPSGTDVPAEIENVSDTQD
ncbi:hypothetical protein [Amycolatopsis sp. NPDC051071]|uniref:hypothetical protein n=1 Tax=Amycolatopsis sp. NPDC051071 TaxID=3154637 RepID=UPI003429F669